MNAIPRIEPLEPRYTPAGNVAATLYGGVLFMTGDAFDNAFSVQQSPAGDINVIGLNGTLINGQSSLYIGRGILAGLVIDSGLGNDYIQVLGVVTPNWLWVTAGNENDGIYVGGVSAGAVYLDTQGGNDGVVTSNVFATHLAVVSGGTGIDGYDYDGLYTAQLYIQGFEVIV